METDIALLRDSSFVYSEDPQWPDAGWVDRCEGLPFEVFRGPAVLALRRELLRRRLYWLAACDLDLDDATVQRLYRVEEDDEGCLRLLRAVAESGTMPVGKQSELTHSNGDEQSSVRRTAHTVAALTTAFLR